jgi:hypothetical protein
MQEALSRTERRVGAARQETLTSYLVLQGQEVITRLNLTHFEGRDYLDDSSITRTSLNGSP